MGLPFCESCGIIKQVRNPLSLLMMRIMADCSNWLALHLTGNEKSGCFIGADRSSARLLTVRTMRETLLPLLCRSLTFHARYFVGKVGAFCL